MTRLRILMAFLIVAGLVVGGRLSSIGAGEGKALQDNIDKIAAALQKGDKAAAKSQAEAVAKKLEEVVEAMDLMKPRKKGGYGVGSKPGAITPDGIEQMLLKLGRDVPSVNSMKKEGAAYEEMAYRVGAIGLIGHAKAPKTNMGKKTVKDWVTWSDDMVESSIALAAAAKSGAGAGVKAAAAKLNNSCNSCHTVFR